MSRRIWQVALAFAVLAGLGCTGDQFVAAENHQNSYSCSCSCGAQDVHTLTFPMLASGDDAEEGVSTGNVLLTGIILDLVQSADQGQQVVGLRFPSVSIPPGATIDQAFVQFTAAEATSGTCDLTLNGQASANAPGFTATTGDVSSRQKTSASVPWSPGAWAAVNDAGPAQQTPDLSAVIQEIVNTTGWTAGNAIVILVSGTTGLRRADSFDGDKSRAPALHVSFRTNNAFTFAVPVCMTASDNPNLTGNALSDSQYEGLATSDCQNRVEKTINGLAQACGYPTCQCDPVQADPNGVNIKGQPKYAQVCDGACTEVPLSAKCANFNPTTEPPVTTATNATGDAPVCTVHSPLSATLFGQRSQCHVSGTATVLVDGDPPDGGQPAAGGVVELVGRPCAQNQSCSVGLAHAMSVGSVTYSNFWGSATFHDIIALGASLEGQRASVVSGVAAFATSSTANSGRGYRDGDAKSVDASNASPISVTVDWAGATCGVTGSMIGNVDPEAKYCENAGPTANQLCTTDSDCGTDQACSGANGQCLCQAKASTTGLSLGVDVSGAIVNEPPSADAGPNQPSVECNFPGGGRLVLDGTGSTDHEHNITDARWFLGDRTGPEIGYGLRAVVDQALGTQQSYVLRVIDAFGQSDESTTSAKVVDTTAPTILCNAPATITPPKAPVTYRATAVDVCDPQVTAVVSSPSCFSFNKTGKKVLRTDCIVTITPPNTITISDSGGVDDYVVWTASAGDDTGNSTSVQCQVHILKP